MALIKVNPPDDLREPSMLVALDGWVDAGSAATNAAERVADGGNVIGELDADVLFDYRARRPALEIRDGRPRTLTWSKLTITRSRYGARDILVLSGAEPDFRWRELSKEMVALAEKLGIVQWISLGAIPAAVPHTRPVPILGTTSKPGLLRGDVQPGPTGTLRVPAACISVLDVAVSKAGIPSVGYFAQVPHYVNGPYATAALALLEAVNRHLEIEVTPGPLANEAMLLRQRLDAATSADDSTRQYVERLETMTDEARLPEGDDLIADIERFLRERGNELGGSGRPN
ncbi:MAG TPA: PAC2 family protein [Candidatus Limnocylindrales bacterium]|nr:PAC2 family protein [Candidatus Limnocylindrales bacterium]